MTRLEVRPTVPEDVATLVPGETVPWRFWGETILEDGKPIAIGGLVYMPDGTVAAFVHGAEHAKRYPLAFHKAVKRGLTEARRRGIRRIAAEAQAGNDAAERWLVRLGFEPSGQERVFVWR